MGTACSGRVSSNLEQMHLRCSQLLLVADVGTGLQQRLISSGTAGTPMGPETAHVVMTSLHIKSSFAASRFLANTAAVHVHSPPVHIYTAPYQAQTRHCSTIPDFHLIAAGDAVLPMAVCTQPYRTYQPLQLLGSVACNGAISTAVRALPLPLTSPPDLNLLSLVATSSTAAASAPAAIHCTGVKLLPAVPCSSVVPVCHSAVLQPMDNIAVCAMQCPLLHRLLS